MTYIASETYIASDVTSHKKQQNIRFRGGNLNSFRDIWALSVSRGTGQLRVVMTYIPQDVF
jgi:hypothetical protein